MPPSNNDFDDDLVKMVESACVYAKDRERNMGCLDRIVSGFIDKLEKMKLESIIEKEIRDSVYTILKFTTGPSLSEILPGEVDWLLIQLSLPPELKSPSREELLYILKPYQTFREINPVSHNFATLVVDSLSKLPSDIYEWTIDNVCFVSSHEDTLAFNLRIGGLEAQLIKEFVFLCENLKYETKEVQTKTIAHEIAHIKLGHTTPPFRKLSIEEKKKREEDTDKLADKWLASKLTEAVKEKDG